MGSAALRDAIHGIIDWGETVGGVGGGLPRATEAFGSLTFNDEAQKTRLPKPRTRRSAGRFCRASRSTRRWPMSWPVR